MSEKVHDLLSVYLLSEHFENPDISLEQAWLNLQLKK